MFSLAAGRSKCKCSLARESPCLHPTTTRIQINVHTQCGQEERKTFSGGFLPVAVGRTRQKDSRVENRARSFVRETGPHFDAAGFFLPMECYEWKIAWSGVRALRACACSSLCGFFLWTLFRFSLLCCRNGFHKISIRLTKYELSCRFLAIARFQCVAFGLENFFSSHMVHLFDCFLVYNSP